MELWHFALASFIGQLVALMLCYLVFDRKKSNVQDVGDTVGRRSGGGSTRKLG